MFVPLNIDGLPPIEKADVVDIPPVPEFILPKALVALNG
jgi:hypothetical protein